MTGELVIIALLLVLIISNIMLWRTVLDGDKLFEQLIDELIRIDRRLKYGRRNEKEPDWISMLRGDNETRDKQGKEKEL